jgi:1-acyl-sn-glycerol-3-phosphate acyltransferase
MIIISYLRIIAHVFFGLFIVTFSYPRKSLLEREALIQNWSSKLLKILNVELQVEGGIPENFQSHLIVSNHISWLDIHVINALVPVRFVAKKEVASWPVFGVFAKRINTLFIDRQKSGHSKDVSEQMAVALRAGDRICIFPEGTSSDGLSVLKFRSNLFQAAIDAQCICLPAAISYINPKSGELSTATAFIGDMGLLESINNTLKHAPLVVRVRIGDPLVGIDSRKVLSDKAWEQVVNLRN